MAQTWGFRSTILASAAASLFACHPTGIDDSSETDVVVTRQANEYNYSQNKTYDIPDKIADLCTVDPSQFPDAGAAGEGPTRPDLNCNEITHAFDTKILDDIETHLKALGYTRVAAGETPDVVMLVGALSSNNWVAYTWYPWNYWYYWWPPYYGWGGIYYPYYPVTSVVNYPTGSLVMDLVSLKTSDPDHRTPAIWTGYISGLLAQGEQSSATRIDNSIDQAFAQSPYLKVGNK
ncbi:MAG TPA: DUF4136 domain-containing protein [Polyangiaceae bacterium]|nr:DUF4136 domain-containing protein [Polyangiaceae bacterium]